MTSSSWTVAHRRNGLHQKICNYIVLSEFDINTGSTVRHQYPLPIPHVKEDWLADSMLPEGAHNRDEDVTYIFLNRNQRRLDEDYLIHPTLKTEDNDKSTKEYFLYGFNLVRTKHDSSVRRGAVVKALAVFSSYRFVDKLYPLLNRALEQYFVTPQLDIIERLFTTLNSCDLTGMPCPNLLEQSLMKRGVSTHPLNPITHPPSPKRGKRQPTAHLPTAWTYTAQFTDTLNDKNIPAGGTWQTLLPLYRDLDDVGDASVSWLARTFGEATMRIYGAILGDDTILRIDPLYL